MNESVRRCCVLLSQTISDAMKAIECGGEGIALVLDAEERLVGTLTDGNIRRAILSGYLLDSPLAPHINRNFTAVGCEVDRCHVVDIMKARYINQIPIIDNRGQLLGIHLIREIIGASPRPNWAVIMAGGKGIRLRPITEHLPKPMIPVAGRPILERLVLHLVGYGIRRVFLSINYLGHMIEEHFGNGEKFGCRIDYLRESQSLGTGGALALLPEDPVEPLLVINGDLVTQVNIGLLLDSHRKGGHVATLGVSEYSHTVPFGCVLVHQGRITQFEEKPVLSRLINTGIYVLSPDLLSRVPAGQNYPITNLFEDCVRRGESVGIYEVEKDWIDVGLREQLKKARGEAV